MFSAGRRPWVRLVLLLTVCACLRGGESPPGPGPAENSNPTSAEIDRLIRQLGSQRFAERETAAKSLDAISYPALNALRNAEARDKDLEVRRRAAVLILRIENHLDALAVEYRE